MDDAANAAVGEARADVVMAVAMDTKDSMASRRDGCCGSFASLLCLKLSSSSWLRSSVIIILLLLRFVRSVLLLFVESSSSWNEENAVIAVVVLR